MKKTIKLAVVAALALGATSAFATNGSNLIGVGAKARGMGGAGIGVSHGAESALANPAMITSVKNTEVSFGGTVFMPSVSNDMSMGGGEVNSAADLSVIPSVSLVSKVTENFYMGVGMWGTAGMGTDYRNSPANMQMVTNLQLMQFGVPLAYKVDGLSLAVTPLVQYGALDINYAKQDGPSSTKGVAQDIQFGYTLGAAYEVDGFTIGAVYKSEIEMKYNGQISQAMSDFSNPRIDPSNFSDKLSTPEEIGFGVSYNANEHTFAVDYKRINWSKAKGYEDFAWKDQDVYILGYEYATKAWAARLGYNYAKSPISEQTGQMGGLTNTLNLLGFPAIVESHIAVGGTYKITEQTSFDLAYVHAMEKKERFTGMMGPVATKHSQSAVTAQVNLAF